MCGICGVVELSGSPREPVTRDVLDRMTDLMWRRGPDDRGTHLAPGIALGVRRLSIVDVEGGHQPVTDEAGGIWAIQNGELYNHELVRARLSGRGHAFRSRCDTEVLPHLYEEHGARFPSELRGEFAIAVWDEARRRAVLARDHLGVKPLYYSVREDSLVFASELKSVLTATETTPALDLEAIDAYLTLGYFPADTTPLQGVRKLLPGHLLIAENGRIEIEPFWELPYPSGEGYDCSDEELAERLLAELEEAVRLRLMSDVPLGAMLSGGLDSSVIVALMARHATGELRTFSVGFENDTRSELPQAREVARRFGARHEEVVLGADEQDIALDELAWHLDEPVADLSTLGFFALCRVAAQHVTVALCGQGADELLGGYPSHRNAAAARFARGPLRGAASLASRIGPVRTRRAASVVGAPDAVARFVRQAAHIDDERRARLYRGPLADYRGRYVERLCSTLLDGHSGSPLQDTLYLSAKLALVDDMLLYFDRTSMACSLEVRPPFLDHRLVEWCARVPDRLKVDSRYRGKALLRAAAKDLIPPRILERPKVGFFSGAVSSWFRAQADGALADWLLQPNAACAELLDRTEVERLVLGANGANSRDESNLLLAILMLEVWLSSVPRRASSEAAPAAPGGAAA